MSINAKIFSKVTTEFKNTLKRIVQTPGGPESIIRKWKREPERERETDRQKERHGDPSSEGAKVL